MENNLYVWIEKKRYTLYQLLPGRWRLVSPAARRELNVDSEYGLQYWRQRGVIQGEEEKKNKGS